MIRSICLSFVCLCLTISHVYGKLENDGIDLKIIYKEIIELRETVQKLDNVVQGQSARISDLESTVTIQRNHIQDLMTDRKTDTEYRRKMERQLKVIENNFVRKYSDPKDYVVKSSNISPHENVDKQENTYYKSGIDRSVKEMVNPKLNAISRKGKV
ncbi:unnamed protein product [Mytilus coruscus]|uniref:Uncharacterized protein n=1 Tax=Mytilus coruscus TaxID=42192 RepID=A0A6J8E7L9_MYTCO|nr:unnamed protein product [Mytilus coruscus]